MIPGRKPLDDCRTVGTPSDDASEVRVAMENTLRLLARMIARACIRELASDPRCRGQWLGDFRAVPGDTASAATEAQGKLVLSVPEAAKLLGISRPTAYQLAQTRQIPTIRLGRRILVPRAALMEMIRKADTGPLSS